MRVERFAACLKKVAATGWFSVGLAPMTMMTSESSQAVKGAVTAPEPMPSSSAATEEAWHSRVQWSTLLVPKPWRTIFYTRYASSFEPLAEPKPASAEGARDPRLLGHYAYIDAYIRVRTSSGTLRKPMRIWPIMGSLSPMPRSF